MCCLQQDTNGVFFSPLQTIKTFETTWKSVLCFCIPDTLLPLINCRRQTIAQIVFPGQGNTAWINSITWYSLSSECGQFSRRSAPFFFIPKTIWWPPSGAPAGPAETNRIVELESACVDIALRCGLVKVNRYLVWDRGAIMQTRQPRQEVASLEGLVFHVFLAIIYGVRV